MKSACVEITPRALWEALRNWRRVCIEPDRPGTYTQAPTLAECNDILAAARRASSMPDERE